MNAGDLIQVHTLWLCAALASAAAFGFAGGALFVIYLLRKKGIIP